MKTIMLFYLILLSVIFKTNVYASNDFVHIVRIEDDASLIKKIDTKVTKSARRFFYKSANNIMTEEKRIYENTYRKFYFINNNKDILLTLNMANIPQDNYALPIPTKALFNFKGYKDFMQNYASYLTELLSEQKVYNILGKEYYIESISRIRNDFFTINGYIMSFMNRKYIYLSEFSSLINSLSIMDKNIIRAQQEINTLENFFDEETQNERYRKGKIKVKNFITSSDTLTDSNKLEG